jgi:hypothetical protein
LGVENENKIKIHIKKLQKFGFAPTRESVRSMAYHLAEQLKIKNSFNKVKRLVGYDRLKMFLKRHPDLSVRKSEGVSLARCQGMSRAKVGSYFDLLEKTLSENSLINKPGHIQGVPELADQTYSAFSLVITESNSV